MRRVAKSLRAAFGSSRLTRIKKIAKALEGAWGSSRINDITLALTSAWDGDSALLRKLIDALLYAFNSISAITSALINAGFGAVAVATGINLAR